MKKSTVYAFIDSQNLNLGTSKSIFKGNKIIYYGWKLDFKKFRRYLSDKFRVQKAFLCIGYIENNSKMYDALRLFGYELVFKPTVIDGNGKTKGNVDAELVLHAAAIEYPDYDKAIVISGDGDFYCLYKYLLKKKKLLNIIIPNRKSSSSLLSEFENYKVFLIRDSGKVEFANKNGRRSALPRR